jgi:hypothetical protein
MKTLISDDGSVLTTIYFGKEIFSSQFLDCPLEKLISKFISFEIMYGIEKFEEILFNTYHKETADKFIRLINEIVILKTA